MISNLFTIEKESEEIRSMLKEEARQREMKIKEVKKEIDDKEQKIEKVSIIQFTHTYVWQSVYVNRYR